MNRTGALSRGFTRFDPLLVVVALGLGLLVVPVVHVLGGEPFVGIVLSVVPSTILSIALVTVGYWLLDSPFDRRNRYRIVAWTLLGFALLGLALALLTTYQRAHGGVLVDAAYFVSSAATGGAAIGLIVGTYDARRRRFAERNRESQRQLELLHRVLNHDVRNGLNVILGHTDLSRDVHGEDEHLDAVVRESRHLIQLTESSSTLRGSVTSDGNGDLEPVALQRVVEDVVENARVVHDHVTIEYRVDAPDSIAVEATELLSSVFENLLHNAVRHNDTDTPSVTVTVETSGNSVLVRVVDDGPGISDGRKDSVFGRGEKGLDSPGTGLGLYLVDSLVDTYGGSVWVEDNEPRGAVFCVSLPVLDDPDAA